MVQNEIDALNAKVTRKTVLSLNFTLESRGRFNEVSIYQRGAVVARNDKTYIARHPVKNGKFKHTDWFLWLKDGTYMSAPSEKE